MATQPQPSSENFVSPVRRGDAITAVHYNSMVASQNKFNRRSVKQEVQPNTLLQPLVKNNTGTALGLFSIVKLSSPYISNGTNYPMAGINCQNYLLGITPTGEGESIGICYMPALSGSIQPYTVIGGTYCRVQVTSATANCKYATSTAGQTGYLVASNSGQARIVWKESGTGIKWAYVILDSSGGSTCQKKFVKYNGVDSNNTGKFAPTNSSGTVLSADTSTYINATVAPYLYIDALEVGGLYRAEYFDEYNGWFITDGQCSDFVSPYAPVRMQSVTAQPLEARSGSFTTATVLSWGANAVVIASYNATLSTITESNAFAQTPTFSVISNSNTKYYTYSGLKLKKKANGMAVYDVYSRDSDSGANSAYRLSFKVKATNHAPTLIWDSNNTENVSGSYVYQGTQDVNATNVTIATASDEDGDTLSLDSIVWTDSNSIFSSKSLTIDANGVIKLTYSTNNKKYGDVTATFRIDDGWEFQADYGTYNTYTLKISIAQVNNAPTLSWVNGSNFTISQSEEFSRTCIATVSDIDADTLSLAYVVWNGDEILDSKSLTLEGNNLYLAFSPKDDEYGFVTVKFYIDDGNIEKEELDSYDDYVEYQINIEVTE